MNNNKQLKYNIKINNNIEKRLNAFKGVYV